MILEVRDDGVAIVEIKSKKQELLLGVAIISILKQIKPLDVFVAGVMAGKISTEDFGVQTNTVKLDMGEDSEKAIRKLQRQHPAEDSDIPEYVKRSLHEK